MALIVMAVVLSILRETSIPNSIGEALASELTSPVI
jgi:hypothetical protein